MRKSLWTVVLGMFLTTGLVLGSQAMCGDCGGGTMGEGKMMHGKRGGMMGEGMPERMKKGLKLTPEQEDSLNAEVKRFTEETKPLRESLMEKRKALREAENTSEEFTPELEKQIDEVSALQAKVEKARVQHKIKVNTILTPEQRAKKAEMNEKKFKEREKKAKKDKKTKRSKEERKN
ncbi:MAG: periplasmic heavy metal sensor [Endomicrobiales bacterium]|nr:periplasmic heavy metal sensor [Endomicrobiales bacterium]